MALFSFRANCPRRFGFYQRSMRVIHLAPYVSPMCTSLEICTDGIVPCTPDDLLPGLGDEYVDGWVYANSSDERPTAGLPTYDCRCPYFKAG